MSPNPLKVLKNPTLAETQKALAQAVRFGNNFANPELPTNRLAVYARLVRNNTLGFIERCFVEAPKFIDEAYWAEIKEKFVREGESHSPYFQEIAAEFLHFCQQNACFSQEVLALMDFEQTQLLAEVSMEKIAPEFEWSHDSKMGLSTAAFLRSYEVDFVSSNFEQLAQEPSQLLVWRNSRYEVLYQAVSDIDFFLLNLLNDEEQSLNQLLNALDEIILNKDELARLVAERWQHWVNQDVILLA